MRMERSRQVAQTADLVLFTLDASTGWTDDYDLIYRQVNQRPLILVLNKVDLLPTPVSLPKHLSHPTVKTATAHQQGIDDMETAILEAMHADHLTAANLDLAINQRQAAALRRAHTAFLHVQDTIAQQLPLDFWTIDLRDAIQALGKITGEEITESVLDRIFNKFCIGK